MDIALRWTRKHPLVIRKGENCNNVYFDSGPHSLFIVRQNVEPFGPRDVLRLENGV